MILSAQSERHRLAQELSAWHGTKDPFELAQRLGVRIHSVDGPPEIHAGRLVLSSYASSPPTITVYLGSIEWAAHTGRTTQRRIFARSFENLQRAAIAHELYHHLEAIGVCEAKSRTFSEAAAQAFAEAVSGV